MKGFECIQLIEPVVFVRNPNNIFDEGSVNVLESSCPLNGLLHFQSHLQGALTNVSTGFRLS